jgi:ferredoxin-NADP reductase
MTHQLHFVRRESEAENINSFYFEPQPELAFTAGQYLSCTLPHAKVDDRGLERAFTIASAPSERLVRVTTRLSERPSSFKSALLDLQQGDSIEVDGPFGDFVLRDDDTHAVFIAGGIGITPFRSIIGDLASTGQRRRITLLYSNSTTDIAFRPFLDDLARRWPELSVVYTVTRAGSDWDGPRRRIDAEFIGRYVPAADAATFYVCGPTPMVSAVRSTLAEAGVDRTQVVYETFPGYEIAERKVIAAAR